MFNGLLKQQRENKDRFDREMRSARVASLELMQSDTKLPEDLGLLDSTLILNWRNQPSPISVEFFSFQWNRLKKRAREFFRYEQRRHRRALEQPLTRALQPLGLQISERLL